MAALEFPENPVLNQTYDFPPFQYIWDGVKWKTVGRGADTVAEAINAHKSAVDQHSIAGVTGLQTALDGKQPLSPVLTAVASGVQAALGFTNAIINGDMRIVQRSSRMPISVPHNYFEYGVDRFYLGNTAGASSNVVMSYRHVAGPNAEFPWAAQAYTVSTGAFASPGVCYFEQPIEGLNLAGFIGVPLVVSFLVKSSVVGKYSVGLMANDASPYSFITSITINAADTWEKKVVKFPLGVPAAYVSAFDNACRLRLRIAFAGANTTSAADAWASGNFFTVSGQAHMPTAVGNTFSWTGVQLAVGTEEKPFEHKPYGYELSSCRRYYRQLDSALAYSMFDLGYFETTTAFHTMLDVEGMRTSAPSISTAGTFQGESHGGTLTFQGANPGAVGYTMRTNWTASVAASAGVSTLLRDGGQNTAKIFITAEI